MFLSAGGRERGGLGLKAVTDQPPEVIVDDVQHDGASLAVASLTTVRLSSLFSASDADSDDILKVQVEVPGATSMPNPTAWAGTTMSLYSTAASTP